MYNQQKLLEVQNLNKIFHNGFSLINFLPHKKFVYKNNTQVLKDINFNIHINECVGIFGKSGCGKTTLLYCIARIIEPSSGTVIFDGENWLKLNSKQLRKKAKKIQIIFQDSYSFANPNYEVQQILEEPLVINFNMDKHTRLNLINTFLDMTQLQHNIKTKKINELSGGQRQRINIIRAFILKPKLILADELTNFLDIHLQLEILNTLTFLLKEFNSSCILVSHDLRVLQHICNKIIFMDDGKIIEIINTQDIIKSSNPQIKHTLELFDSLKMRKTRKG